jgi:hypothetical protein
VDARTVTALDAITAFAVPNPNCPSQSRRFFQVWLLFGLPRQADHSAYFGLAKFCLRQPFQPSTGATLEICSKIVNAPFRCKRPAAMDQNPETQAVESLLLNECEIKFFLFFHSHMHRSSNVLVLRQTQEPNLQKIPSASHVDYVRLARYPKAIRRLANRSEFQTPTALMQEAAGYGPTRHRLRSHTSLGFGPVRPSRPATLPTPLSVRSNSHVWDSRSLPNWRLACSSTRRNPAFW